MILFLQITANQTIYITVLDINDHAPVFPPPKVYHASIPEELPLGTFVVSVSAEDKDIGENAKRTYRASATNQFYMDSIYSTGAGTVKVGVVRSL